MDRDAFKKACKAQWKNADDHGYIFVNTRKPAVDKADDEYEDEVIPDEEESDDYAEDYSPIIQEIDEFDDMLASGEGLMFLSDNNEELLNRLRVILAAVKEGHRSNRQYNEVNCILKRLLEKGIIDKNDYKSVIKNVK
ncbi:hypothetical protein LOTGIDRAFT_176326 [Lottia gigantea]|uniref:Uncharacterized protein n=1 Tax=Lottia gigantea TaxID=225164 RepID=V4B100_LOTGI|nr:hypothetical protein LOTGIDRAFT_176326 [Lottia gigantea]ESO81894.1 hypothetical protein LOTGIDRAFT_176326 [Lottia gigantea]